MALAEQTLVQVRVDKNLRDEAASIFSQLGMDIPTAIRMFFKRSIMERGLPFAATLPSAEASRAEALKAFDELRAEAANMPEISSSDIDAEISAVRAENKRRK